jgi:hypothetical protein
MARLCSLKCSLEAASLAILTNLTIPTVLIPLRALWNSSGTDGVPNCKPLDNRLF